MTPNSAAQRAAKVETVSFGFRPLQQSSRQHEIRRDSQSPSRTSKVEVPVDLDLLEVSISHFLTLEQTARTEIGQFRPSVRAGWYELASAALSRQIETPPSGTDDPATPPTQSAVRAAWAVLHRLSESDVMPSHMSRTAEEGLAFAFFTRAGLVRLDCQYDGAVALELPDTTEPEIAEYQDQAALEQFVRVVSGMERFSRTGTTAALGQTR